MIQLKVCWYADYTILVGFILCNNESSERNDSLSWSSINKLVLTVSKTKELVSQLCKVNSTRPPQTINVNNVLKSLKWKGNSNCTFKILKTMIYPGKMIYKVL